MGKSWGGGGRKLWKGRRTERFETGLAVGEKGLGRGGKLTMGRGEKRGNEEKRGEKEEGSGRKEKEIWELWE
jgi:hypothetical protein